ncbi:thiamine phosphate synthase [Weeksellaceae bacterium TAE3-ERU29]|nr:thiamine phosphate synthase [Weeksellaceae bacterium TAE3-ERU29]
MFVVVTPETEVPDEVNLIRKMAEFPISIHVRKPNFSQGEMQKWLQQFDENQHQKMMLHQHHEFCEHFDLKGLHFKEIHRKETDFIHKVWHYRFIGKTLSASFHSQKEAESQFLYDYVLLSPVFNSISKVGYEGKTFCLGNPLSPIIALGGITRNNIEQTKINGFSGIAVLGSIWQNPQPFEEFKELFRCYEEIYL